MFVFLEINIKLEENRIAVLCRWNYLKVCWGGELKFVFFCLFSFFFPVN